MILRVRLPYPSSKLNTNRYRGQHWGSTTAAMRAARQDGYFSALAAMVIVSRRFVTGKPLRLRLAIFPPDDRKRDMDNAVGALKSYQDGVFDYLEMDDSLIKRKTITWHNKCKHGKVYYILYQ